MGKRQFAKKIFGGLHRHDAVLDMIEGQGVTTGRVLDAGAREGDLARRLHARRFDVVAADIAAKPEAFRLGVPWVRADFNGDFPFADGRFDVVISSNTIEYLENQCHFVRECHRILADNGMLLLATPNIMNLQSRMAMAMAGFYRLNGRPYDEVRGAEFSDRRSNLKSYFQLRNILHMNGFRLVDLDTHEFSNLAMLLLPAYPLVYGLTALAFRHETHAPQKLRNREIFRHVMSLELILGKQLHLLARKVSA